MRPLPVEPKPTSVMGTKTKFYKRVDMELQFIVFNLFEWTHLWHIYFFLIVNLYVNEMLLY